ncbi:MAG: glycosyltransferase family 2 protein [Solirubrobacterales bacterium]|nr:glycosyltransferase family 2 protein [Solirubrobacterales bacterium]
MPEPQVTIVVPVHNGERYLSQALESIAAQTFDAWETVVVDDASSDGSLELATAFARGHPGRVQVIPLTENLGVAGARNAGLRAAARGRLVVLLDQDDYLLDHYLDTTVRLFDAGQAAGRRMGIVVPDGFIQTDGGIQHTSSEYYWWCDQLDYERMLECNYITGRATFSRAAFDEVGGFDAACLTADDYDMWLRLLEAGYEVVTTREPLYVYRIHADAQTQDKLKVAHGALAAFDAARRRGTLSPRQGRIVQRRVRHYRAVRDRAVVARALAERRFAAAARVALTGAPSAAMAVLEHPRWWPRRRRRVLGSSAS